jgi:peptidoglycan hydrolase-like protein with peptidoglycan-binding domain
MANLQLLVGSFGEEVKRLHRKLIEQGVEIPSSELDRGFFGPATRYAVRQWQRNHGLPASGIIDERTNATLETAPKRGWLRFYFSSERLLNFLLVSLLKRFVKNCSRIKCFRQ